MTSVKNSWLVAGGVAASIAMVVSSFGAGATRNRGGVLEYLGLSYLAYGHGAQMSNAVLWLGMLGIIACWALLGHSVVTQRISFPQVRSTLWAWIAPLLFACPILSRDVYSYLMQGAMLRDGFDPYTQGAAVNPGPMLLEVSHDWRNTTTPYGPLHLWIGDVITSVVGDNITAGVFLYKLVSFAGFALIAWSVPHIAEFMGVDRSFAFWLCVANPVMVFHLIGGMHNESLMVGLVSVGVLAALRSHFVTAVVAIAISVSLKATAVFALPFVVWMGLRHLEGTSAKPLTWARKFGLFVFTGSWMTALTIAVVAAVTRLSGASWGWISQISGNSKVINPLAFPSLLASVITPVGKLFDDNFAYNEVLKITRPLSQVLMLLGLAIVWWIFRKTKQRAVHGIVAAYCAAVLFNAVTLPWYYTSLLNFFGALPLRKTLLQLGTGLSMVVAASFTGSGNHQLYNVSWMLLIGSLAWWLTAYIYGETTSGQVRSRPEAAATEA